MKISNEKGKIVCDMLGCGCLSTYRLTFAKNSNSILLCENCFNELKEAIEQKEADKKDKGAKKASEKC